MAALHTIAITGGGTGGHISPAVAIVDSLRGKYPDARVIWLGRRGGMEESTADRLGIPFRPVASTSWPRGGLVRKINAAARLVLGIVGSAVVLLGQRPAVVVAVGGFVCVPATLAAQLLRIPTVLHEQNKRMGLANGLLARRASRILLSFPDTDGRYPRERSILVGNPVRGGFVSPPSRAEACERFGLDPSRAVVLVSGGSQGARTLNEALEGVLRSGVSDDMQFVWATGKTDSERWRSAAGSARCKVVVYEFIDDMAGAFASATLVVSRAGASTTAEIAAMGKPSILIPYPYSADGHQDENARAFEEAGAALVFRDSDWDAEAMSEVLRKVPGDRAKIEQMKNAALGLARPDAASDILREIELAAFGADSISQNH